MRNEQKFQRSERYQIEEEEDKKNKTTSRSMDKKREDKKRMKHYFLLDVHNERNNFVQTII